MKHATSPVWEVGLGLHPSSSPTHKGSTTYHVRLSIGRSGLLPLRPTATMRRTSARSFLYDDRRLEVRD